MSKWLTDDYKLNIGNIIKSFYFSRRDMTHEQIMDLIQYIQALEVRIEQLEKAGDLMAASIQLITAKYIHPLFSRKDIEEMAKAAEKNWLTVRQGDETT